MLDELFKLVWNLITFPFRLVGSIIKTIVFGPLLALGTFIVIIVVCIALMAPKQWVFLDCYPIHNTFYAPQI